MPDNQKKLFKFWHELKRRKVVAVIISYAAIAFILLQLANLLEESLDLPLWFDKLITILLLIGFPIAIIFSWIFDVSSKGITKTEPESAEKQPVTHFNDAPEKSIIVLPFENISSDPEQEYFSDGLTEEIITDLSYISDLLVISRNSAMTFKGSKKKTSEIAGDVNVRYVLQGSVRKSENNLRINAQLIDANKDTHMWAEKYIGTLDNVFDIQEKVSKSIVEALKIKLNPQEKERISEVNIDNIQAFECYLQARQEIYRFTEDGLVRGIQHIKNGLEIIGENEILYAAMGTAYFFYVDAGIKPGTDYLQKIEECSQKIFHLSPESAHGYFLSGAVHFLRRNLQHAVIDLKKSLEKNPNNPDCLVQLTRIYSSCGQNDAAWKLLDKTLAIDPFNAIAFSLPGYLHLLNGDSEKAREAYHKMYKMDPESPIFGWFYALALIFAKQNEEAFKIIDRFEKIAPQSTYTRYALFLKFSVLGDKEKALEIITPELENVAKAIEYHSRTITWGYALLGEKKKALDWLENTIACGFINYPFLVEIDPFLENIRGEIRFKKLMERVKHEWENFEV